MIGSKIEAISLFRSPYYLPSYRFPYNPDPLARGNNYKIYDDMQDDDQVKAAVSIKKDMVVNTGWQIVTDDQEIKDFLTENLQQVNAESGIAGSFEDVLRDMLSAYVYGFSMTEPVYKLDPKLGLWKISEMRTRPPHSFRFDIDDKGNVTKIHQVGAPKDMEFDDKVFLHHVYQMEFGNPYGRSDFRAAHAAWKAKYFIMRFYNIYLEKYASPTIVGKYKGSIDKALISEILAILQNMQQNTAMAIPEDFIVDFVQSQRDASTAYGDAMDKYDTKIARAILMPDLLGFSGAKTGGGSLALGREQFKVFLGVIKKDRESVQSKITQRLIKPLATVNWGEERAADVKFEFVPFSDDNILDAAKLWADAVQAVGWKPLPEEINHLRAITGFPEGAVEMTQPAPMIGPDGQPIMPKGVPGFDKGAPPKAEKPDVSDAVDKAKQEADDNAGDGQTDQSDGKNNYNLRIYAGRKLTIFEKKVDFNNIETVLDRSEKRIGPPLRRAAKVIVDDIITQARDRGVMRKVKPEAINAIEPRFLRDMNMIFKNHFTDLFKMSMKQAQSEIYKDKAQVAKFVDDNSLMPDQLLDILKAESFKVVGDYSTDITKKARNIILQGMKDGLGEGDIVSLLRDELSQYTERWLATVIRTKTTEIYNDGRKSFWDSDQFSNQVIEAYQFSAILDDRTTDVCRELDGKIFDRGDFLNTITPPLHLNCRSLLVPVTRFEPYKEDPDYVTKAKEPSLESLRSLGGNLIAAKKE